MRGENLRQRPQLASPGEEESHGNNLVSATLQVRDSVADRFTGKAIAFGGVLNEIFFSLRESQFFRAMIGLISTVLGMHLIRDNVHAPTFDDVDSPGNSHQHSPSGMYADAKGSTLHDETV